MDFLGTSSLVPRTVMQKDQPSVDCIVSSISEFPFASVIWKLIVIVNRPICSYVRLEREVFC